MTYKALRRYMQSKMTKIPHRLKNCTLVIDGRSYFNNSYKKSGCEFIYGPECDKYAEYLINELKCFIDNNVKCYVIFNGCTKSKIQEKKEMHQKIIDSRNDIDINMDEKMNSFEPAFVKDVQREVLDKLNIKYFTCEYDSTEAIVSVARKLKCPVLTHKIEYCLYGVACVVPFQVMAKLLKSEKEIICGLYEHKYAKSVFGIYDETPIFLTLLNESGAHFEKLPNLIDCNDDRIVVSAIRWVKSQRKNAVDNISSKIDNEAERKAFLELYEKIDLIYTYSLGTLAVKQLLRDKPYGLFKDDKKWFAKGVANGKIAVPFVNLKKNNTFCGSHLVFNCSKPDAMLAALDIITFSHNLLTNSQKSKLTFVGRQYESCRVWEISTERDIEISNRSIFTNTKKVKGLKVRPNPFIVFLKETLPNFDMNNLSDVPEDCQTLVLSLVYYVSRVNKDFVYGAYCVLLCYVMLGPIAKTMDGTGWNPLNLIPLLAKNLALNLEDCKKMHRILEKYFKDAHSSCKLDRKLLHTLAEFQHCLQHMNYLITLCGKGSPPCTVYHTTYNGTFVYNLYLSMKNKDNLVTFMNQLEPSSVFNYYKKVVICFKKCMKIVSKE